MRVLVSALSCNPSLGSEALVGFKYAEALAREHEVIVLASSPSQTPGGARLHACEAGPCSFNEVGPVPLLRFEWRQSRVARRIAASFCFDAVHKITPGSMNLPTWTYRLGKPFIAGPLIAAPRPPASFDSFMKGPMRPSQNRHSHPARLANRLCREIVDRAGRKGAHLHRAARILVGTRTAERMLPESCRAKARFVTYSGVEHDLFRPGSARDQSGVTRLLYVGRLVPYKGPELLIRAFAQAAKGAPLHLTLVGEGDATYARHLAEVARDLELKVETPEATAVGNQRSASTVRFVRAVARAELPSVYDHADIFCFPTLCDTYGIALLEAMSCGCAPIVSDVAGAGEIVNGGNGLKVSLENPQQYFAAFSDSILALARNGERRAQIGAAARAYILQNHDWSKIGRELLGIYREFENAIENL